jgi:hypothetical protein
VLRRALFREQLNELIPRQKGHVHVDQSHVGSKACDCVRSVERPLVRHDIEPCAAKDSRRRTEHRSVVVDEKDPAPINHGGDATDMAGPAPLTRSNRVVNVVPIPSSLCTETVAPSNSAICFTIAKPSPVPP